ncbi:MAG TPA: flagellar hook-basal body complex protein FliE [Dongiaceae bacterium]|nr:flagellar hook-basal body complex protein FliE [Dongiaceae bacterium]
MANTTISNALAAYANAAKSLAGGDAASGADQGAGDSFGDLLKKAADESVKAGDKSEKQSLLATAGKANVTDVVEAVSSAEVTLQAVTAVRDRVVSAYQEILRMPI